MGSNRVWCLRFVLFGALCLSVFSVPAQTFSEWFSQKKTQKKYLLEQIAALQVYLGYARQGYKIVGSGLQTVRDISHGEFSLHEAFLKGLQVVSPVVKGDYRVAEIVALQLDILRALGKAGSGAGFSGSELAYIGSVSGAVIAECLQDLSELVSLVLSSSVSLSDDERLLRLEGLYQRMLDRSSFVQKFCGDTGSLLRAKKAEQQSLENLRRFYGID